jgi:phosphohistidine phosphatase
MKTIFLVRHAKSSHASEYMHDFDRPLNERGQKEAIAMSEKLFSKINNIDVFISSPAKRALSTCGYFTKIYKKNDNDIVQEAVLYEPRLSAFYAIISSLKNEFETAAIFSHNPAITYFVNELTAHKIDDMPTCSIACIVAETQSWQGFQEAVKKFIFFLQP